MADQKLGRTRRARRNTVLARLLLTAPLAAMAGCATSAGELLGFDLEPPRMHVFLLATPFQVLVSDEQMNAEPMPVVEVQGIDNRPPSTAAGLWREVTPLPADSNTDACLESAATIEHLPEALAPARWYQ